jgi:hypothetical protein
VTGVLSVATAAGLAGYLAGAHVGASASTPAQAGGQASTSAQAPSDSAGFNFPTARSSSGFSSLPVTSSHGS